MHIQTLFVLVLQNLFRQKNTSSKIPVQKKIIPTIYQVTA